jgi:hypothetical protein
VTCFQFLGQLVNDTRHLGMHVGRIMCVCVCVCVVVAITSSLGYASLRIPSL